MKCRPTITAGVTALGGLLSVSIVLATPSKASCVEASVWVNQHQTPTTYVVGPNYCVVPTPWGPAADVGDNINHTDEWTDPGDVTGAGYRVVAPSPAARR